MSSTLLKAFIVASFVFDKTIAQNPTCNRANGKQDLGNRCECCNWQDVSGQEASRLLNVGGIGSAELCRQRCEGVTGAEYYRFRFAGPSDKTGNCRCYPAVSATTYDSQRVIGTVSGNIDSGGVFGDPHIMKWNGKKFDFHGECDLVLVQAPHFDNGFGLDIHIRTTIENFYSYIEEVGIKAGHSIATVNKDGFWFSGDLLTAFPAQNGPFRVTHKTNTDKEGKSVELYEISVNKKPALRVRIPDSKFLFVKVVNGGPFNNNFVGAKGLMGEYGTGKTLGRDGLSEFEDMNEFGKEWQVRPSEDKLFLKVREPQLPKAVCRMPAKRSDVGRKLQKDPSLRGKAEKACSHVDADMFEMCVDDVIGTENVNIALGY